VSRNLTEPLALNIVNLWFIYAKISVGILAGSLSLCI